MRIKSGDFRVREGEKVDLEKWPTMVDPAYKTSEQYQDLLHKHVKALSEQQEMLYASDSYALLLIFQAMDAAGKDGAIRHVMSGINPQGCQVFSFKHPSANELKHDFLWRTTRDQHEARTVVRGSRRRQAQRSPHCVAHRAGHHRSARIELPQNQCRAPARTAAAAQEARELNGHERRHRMRCRLNPAPALQSEW